jgi:hypothetical protein
MPESTFTCAGCHCTFQQGWTDADAVAEELVVFGTAHRSDDVVLCDDCYAELLRSTGAARASIARRLLKDAPQ